MPDCNPDRYAEVCKGRFDHIDQKFDRLFALLDGNGQPGLKVRVDRLEQARNANLLSKSEKRRAMWSLVVAAGLAVAAWIWRVVVTVEAHSK